MITEKKTETTEAKTVNVKVIRANKVKEGSFAFDMVVNDITIYGCFINQGTKKDGTEYSFIDFPSRKGKDGNYYNYVWFPITKAIYEDIEKQIEGLL